MKNLLFILTISAMLCASCKKDDPTDPRDKFIGIWQGYSTMNMPDMGVNNQISQVRFRFDKGAYAEQLKISDLNSNDVYTAKINGNTYTFDPYIVIDSSAAFPIRWEQNGTGTLTGTHIDEYSDILYTFDTDEYTGIIIRSLEKQ